MVGVGALPTIACVRDETPTEQARPELVWDFANGRRLPKLKLWPMSPSTPERLKRAISTENDHGRLRAHVDAKDPYFVWRFEKAVGLRLVSVDVEASAPGLLQLFWSNAACPTFRESCSVGEQLRGGRQWVDFLIDQSEFIRELRLDLPEGVDVTLWFYEIGLFERAVLSPRWSGSAGVELAVEPDGLELVSRSNDPWIAVTTTGLDASKFDEVELVVHGTGPIAPQLFWDGPCGHFDEACSVHLAAADAGTLTHSARLTRVPMWRGPIRTLRLDPGNGPGEYTIDRVALTGSNAQRARR
jgi:hypothetical protein